MILILSSYYSLHSVSIGYGIPFEYSNRNEAFELSLLLSGPGALLHYCTPDPMCFREISIAISIALRNTVLFMSEFVLCRVYGPPYLPEHS